MRAATRDTAADRPRVLLLGPSLGALSGIATHLREILHSPLAREFELRQFQTGSQGREESLPGKVARFVCSPVALVAALIRHGVDLVHVNTSMDPKAFWRDAVYVILARASRRKVVYQIHGGARPDEFCAGRLFRRLCRWFLQLPDAVVLLVESDRQSYASFAPIKRLAVIPNGIDVTCYAPDADKAFDRRTLRLVYVGAVHREKGVSELIEAVRILRERSELDGLRLEIAGSGPAEAPLKQRVRELGLERSVRFAGLLSGEEKIRFWRQADLFVFPTYREALPYAVLESLASGTPIVTTAVAGIAEAVVEGEHGVFVPPRDARAVADAIAALRSDPDRLRRMSLRCIVRAQERYTVERLASRMRALYGEVLARDESGRTWADPP